MQMLFTGEPIDARTAEAWGLINQVVPAAELRNATLALAARIAASSPHTVSVGKRAFYEQIGLADRYAYERATAIDDRQRPERGRTRGDVSVSREAPPRLAGALGARR